MKKILFVLSIAAIVTSASAITSSWESLTTFGNFLAETTRPIIGDNRASIFFVPTVSVNELQGKYVAAAYDARQKVRVLVMPGHEPDYGGAEYVGKKGLIRERDMNVELANDLAKLLKSNSRFEVIVPRDGDKWNEPFASYFKTAWSSIIEFAKRQKNEMTQLVRSGRLKLADEDAAVYHNTAPADVAYRIYGINKWANENKIDVAIHVHFNDETEHRLNRPGEYSGFTIYVPDSQYSNSSTTKAIADAIENRMSRYYPTSNLPKESGGIVEDQKLIAVGSHNSSDAPSMLIEYAYIYEPGLQSPTARAMLINDMAFQTYLGLQDFFGSGNDVTLSYSNLILPHKWARAISQNTKPTVESVRDVVALQTALMTEGLYPPEGETKTSCPRSGIFGPCTVRALTQFQKKHGIVGETGVVGPKTRAKLNELYELQMV